MTKETKPSEVGGSSKQDGEVRERFPWAEPAVWTDRMLAALVKGVKGSKWFSLIDKVYRRPNPEAVFRKTKSNRGGAGVDRVTVEKFEERPGKQPVLPTPIEHEVTGFTETLLLI